MLLSDAIQRQIAPSHINRVYSLFVVIVVPGNAFTPSANDAPHVIARAAVPVIQISKKSPVLGVPLRFVLIDVMSAACADRI